MNALFPVSKQNDTADVHARITWRRCGGTGSKVSLETKRLGTYSWRTDWWSFNNCGVCYSERTPVAL